MTSVKRIPIVAGLILTMIITSASSVFASAPKKESIEYKGSGVVEVDFKQDVKYKNSKLTVKDSSGKKYSASVLERDDDDYKFKVKNFKTGKTYKFIISNVRAVGTSGYAKFTGSFKIPKASSKPVIEETTYEGYGEVDVEFKSDVTYKNVSVSVEDENGKSYSTRIVERDDDELTFRLGSYKEGLKYTYTIKGIKKKSASSYTSVSGSFNIPSTSESQKITATQAKEIAFNDAVTRYSIDKNTASVYQCKSDVEHGIMTWDVEFTAKDSTGTWYEFEYEIYANGGAIKSYEKDF